MSVEKTEITEIVTGLGLFGFRDLARALAARPRFITNVDDAVFDRLDAAYAAGTHDDLFAVAWDNGARFARSDDGLRGRPPWLVEWKGPHRPPAYEQIPADLRVDHVYLVSCKYGSKILLNASPWHLFDRALAERTKTSTDWFAEIAPESYAELYTAVRDHLGEPELPHEVGGLTAPHRELLRRRLSGRWPAALRDDWQQLANAVSRGSAERLLERVPTKAAREELLWRLLRLQAAPYFVLGTDVAGAPLRYRVDTPWDFRTRFAVRAVDVWGDAVGQPLVRWRADLTDRVEGRSRIVEGHVEVRWSHGKFGGAPEAKVYLDTPHHEVPGYQPIA